MPRYDMSVTNKHGLTRHWYGEYEDDEEAIKDAKSISYYEDIFISEVDEHYMEKRRVW